MNLSNVSAIETNKLSLVGPFSSGLWVFECKKIVYDKCVCLGHMNPRAQPVFMFYLNTIDKLRKNVSMLS